MVKHALKIADRFADEIIFLKKLEIISDFIGVFNLFILVYYDLQANNHSQQIHNHNKKNISKKLKQ